MLVEQSLNTSIFTKLPSSSFMMILKEWFNKEILLIPFKVLSQNSNIYILCDEIVNFINNPVIEPKTSSYTTRFPITYT